MQPIQGITPVVFGKTQESSEVDKAGSTFSSMLNDLVSDVEQQQASADQAIQELHAGGNTSLHEAMIAMEQADISIRFMVQVRNKAMEAYQEIMRMQV